jgi:hypothetical protein
VAGSGKGGAVARKGQGWRGLRLVASQRGALRRSFATMVSASAAPYGYTITVWSTGALLIHFRHLPQVWEVFLFVAGAVGAFASLWLIGRGAIVEARPVGLGAARALAGALDVFATGLAVGAAALIAMIPSWVAWPFAAFASTALYMVAASLQLALAETRGPG